MTYLFSYESNSEEMLSSLKNVAIDPSTCIINNCSENCSIKACNLCATCLSEPDLQHLKQAYREHTRRGGFKRIFPSSAHFEDKFVAKMMTKTKMSSKWFKAKCQKDAEWC